MAFKINSNEVQKLCLKNDAGIIIDPDVKKLIVNGSTVFERNRNTILIAGTSAGLYYSVDDGKTWIISNINSGSFTKICYSQKWNLYIAVNSTTYIYYSADGKNWASYRYSSSTIITTVDTDNDGYVYACAGRILYWNGTSWSNFIVSNARRVMKDEQTGIVYCVADDGTTYRLNNNFATKIMNAPKTDKDNFYMVLCIANGWLFYTSETDYGDGDYDDSLEVINISSGLHTVLDTFDNDTESFPLVWFSNGYYMYHLGNDSNYMRYSTIPTSGWKSSARTIHTAENSNHYWFPKPVKYIDGEWYHCDYRYIRESSSIGGSQYTYDFGKNNIYEVYSYKPGIILSVQSNGIYLMNQEQTPDGDSFIPHSYWPSTQKLSKKTYTIFRK